MTKSDTKSSHLRADTVCNPYLSLQEKWRLYALPCADWGPLPPPHGCGWCFSELSRSSPSGCDIKPYIHTAVMQSNSTFEVIFKFLKTRKTAYKNQFNSIHTFFKISYAICEWANKIAGLRIWDAEKFGVKELNAIDIALPVQEPLCYAQENKNMEPENDDFRKRVSVVFQWSNSTLHVGSCTCQCGCARQEGTKMKRVCFNTTRLGIEHRDRRAAVETTLLQIGSVAARTESQQFLFRSKSLRKLLEATASGHGGLNLSDGKFTIVQPHIHALSVLSPSGPKAIACRGHARYKAHHCDPHWRSSTVMKTSKRVLQEPGLDSR